jgi:hypothetical protein
MENKTLADFIAAHRIRMTAERTDSNPNMESEQPMNHWRVTFRMGRKRMTTYFSMGLGREGREPRADEVLDSLASDAAGVQNAADFTDWCAEYGFDTDSRKAETVFKACCAGARRLRAFIGEDYEKLLFETDRL